jgi:hypothetical protein
MTAWALTVAKALDLKPQALEQETHDVHGPRGHDLGHLRRPAAPLP